MMKAAARHPLGLLRVVSGAPAAPPAPCSSAKPPPPLGVCRGRRREAMDDASGIAPSHISAHARNLSNDVIEQVLVLDQADAQL